MHCIALTAHLKNCNCVDVLAALLVSKGGGEDGGATNAGDETNEEIEGTGSEEFEGKRLVTFEAEPCNMQAGSARGPLALQQNLR